MENNTIKNAKPNERLAVLFKQTALGVDLEEVLDELSTPDNSRMAGENLAEENAPAVTPQDAAAVRAPWRKQISLILDRVSDWALLAPRFFDLGPGEMGLGTGAHASAGRASTAWRKREGENFRKWRQGDLHLVLNCENEPPFAVTLLIDEGPDVRLQRLCWIEEHSLAGDPNAPAALVAFPLERIGDRAYRVEMSVGKFSARLSAIEAAKKGRKEGGDPRLLLPFVEME